MLEPKAKSEVPRPETGMGWQHELRGWQFGSRGWWCGADARLRVRQS